MADNQLKIIPSWASRGISSMILMVIVSNSLCVSFIQAKYSGTSSVFTIGCSLRFSTACTFDFSLGIQCCFTFLAHKSVL
uniref:Uncharacterized protein n=1 Tax=Kalanchoe fedtschenkoi TaxID=63787 RepID=A0A7N1A2G2_KALFE